MVAITKDSKADPVEGMFTEANTRRNAQTIDVTRAASPFGSTVIVDPPFTGPVTLRAPGTAIPFIDMNPLIPTGEVDASDIFDAMQTLITNYSRVRTIRYVRVGDNFTYQRFAYVDAPDSSPSQLTLVGAGVTFPPTAVVDMSEYLNVVAQARTVMQTNFNTLFATIPYCHVQCHTDNPPPPPPECHQDFIETGDGDGGDGGGC